MRAIAPDTYGTADVLELRDIHRPRIGEDEVLVRVPQKRCGSGISAPPPATPFLS